MTQQTLDAPHVCDYPGCENPAEPAVQGTPAAAPRFCADPEHNSLNLFRRFRARRQHKKTLKEEPEVVPGLITAEAGEVSASPEDSIEPEAMLPLSPEAVESAEEELSVAVSVIESTDATGEPHRRRESSDRRGHGRGGGQRAGFGPVQGHRW